MNGFVLALTNVEATWKQFWDNVKSTLKELCINAVPRLKLDIGFCFILNVGSTLFQRWSITA